MSKSRKASVEASSRTGATGAGPDDRGWELSAPLLVSPGNFLVATRDSGYRSTAMAVAEFIDNSIQAGAGTVRIDVVRGDDADYPVEIVVSDDGGGMTADELSVALTFGGSGRFGDRTSFGRYGMGLPNAAMSRARRVDVYSWQDSGPTLQTTLDLTLMATSNSWTLPSIEVADRPASALDDRRGTVVHLSACDRVEYRRPSTIATKLTSMLGRSYRRYLEAGLEIVVNGTLVPPVDPLYLRQAGNGPVATEFGKELIYRFDAPAGEGTVRVRFSELPVESWHGFTATEKRQRGITGAPNVSIMRADREVAAGWWFMGKKRRQNYDDWWRCEVAFDPVLDELFGITHTKQQITPAPELSAALSRDLEPIANALNARVRRRFELARTAGPLADAALTAMRCVEQLPTLPEPSSAKRSSSSGAYELVVGSVAEACAFELEVHGQDLSVTVNERHPIYRDLLRPLVDSETGADQRAARDVGLMLLALARAEASGPRKADRDRAASFRRTWSDVAATYLNA